MTTVRQRLSWYKDGVEFPWGEQPGRNTVLYSNNRSLVLLEVSNLKSKNCFNFISDYNKLKVLHNAVGAG